MSVKFNTAVTGVLLATSVAVSAAVLPALDAASVADFEDYKPPVRLDVIKYDYMTSTGSPSATPTSFPTWQLKFPYRAFLLGARPTSNNGTQKHDCVIYVVYSKTPTLDFSALHTCRVQSHPPKAGTSAPTIRTAGTPWVVIKIG